jgi:hypothetical protein
MLVFLPLLSFVALLGCDSSDICTQLCNFDGSDVCTKGSWTQNGVCYRYRYLGPLEDGFYCYHTESTQEQCPASGVPVKPEDVDHLISLAKVRRNVSTQPGASTEVTTAPVSADTPSKYTDAVENTYTSGYTYTISGTTNRDIFEPSRYGEFVIPAKTTHSSTILLLHGMGGRAEHMIVRRSSCLWMQVVPSGLK